MKHLHLLISLLFVGTLSAQIPSNGLRVHLKADAGTSTTAENEGVSSWADQSGNGFNATAPGGQPLFVPNAINGYPALYFSGNQSLNIATTGALGLVSNDYEMFIVAKSSDANIQFLVSGSVGHHEAHLNGFGGWRYIPQPDVGINHGANQAYTDGAPRVFGVRTTGADGVARVNGVDVGHSHNSRSSSDAMFRLGLRASGDYPLIGHIAEVIIYNRVLSKIERYQVESYLAQKYGVTGALTTAPTVSLDAPSASQQLGHTVSGTVNPNGSATTYRFLYGTDQDHLTMSTEPISVGSGTSPVSVSASIPGLSRSQIYHVALVAENASHAARTSTQEFTVAAEPTGSAVGSFPTPGLRVHLKADAGTSTTDENQAVNTWLDQSGNGFTAYAPAGQPVYVSSSINGLPALHFNGAQVLHISNTGSIGLTDNDYEMFFVAKSSNANIQFLASGGLPEHEVHLNGASGMRFIPRNPVFIDNGANQAFTDGTQRIFSVRATDATGVSRVNGSDAILASDSRSSVDAMFRLGMRSDGSYALIGHLSEVLIYDRTLSAYERTQVERYLAGKYAISGGALTLPTLVMDAPTTTQDLGVSFSGTVNPNGVATSYRFMYGTDPNNLTLSTEPISVGSGTDPVTVSATIPNLTRHATYHVKLVAETASQVVETSLRSFDMSYLEVASFGWSMGLQDGVTHVDITAQLGVPATAGSEYKVRFGSFETDFQTANDISGTFQVNQRLPNDSLVYGQSYDLVLIGKSPTGKLTYSDTLEVVYFGVPTLILTSAVPSPNGLVNLLGSVNPNGAATSYTIRYGTDLQNLTETSLEAVGSGVSSVAINRILGPLATGQTYHVVLYAENDDFTTVSDTLTFSTAWANATLQIAVADASGSAFFVGYVNPNGYATEYRFRYGTTSAMTSATEWISAGSGTQAVPAFSNGVGIGMNATYQVVMEARTGTNIVRSDTLSFDTYFAELGDVSLQLDLVNNTEVIRVNGSFFTAGSEDATYRVLYGTNTDNLVADEVGFTEGVALPTDSIAFSRALAPSTALQPGTTYYIQIETKSASGRTSLSAIESIRFALRPTVVLDSVTTWQDLSARFDGKINPNGGTVSYKVLLGTDRNQLTQSSGGVEMEDSGLSPVAETLTLTDLTPGTVYYATLAAITEGYPTQTGDTLVVDMRYATISYFNPDVVEPNRATAYIGTTAHGSSKSGRIRYGTQAGNLDQSVSDPSPITGNTMSGRTLDITGLSPDATYFAQWVVEDLNGGPTTVSEVVEFNTVFPVVTIDSVLVVGNLALGVRATVETKNQEVTLKQSLRSAGGSFSTASSGITVAGSDTPVSVLLPLTGLSLDENYEVRLVANNASYNEAYSDTLAFDTYFVRISDATVGYAGADVAVRAELEAQPELEFGYRVLMGTHRDSLSASGDFETISTEDGLTSIQAILEADGFTPDSTYHFAIEARGASGWISRSDTLSLVFLPPPTISRPTDDTRQNLTSTLRSTVRPNGRAIEYWLMLGTSPGSLSQQGAAVSIGADADSVEIVLPLSGLTRFATYHASLVVRPHGEPTEIRSDTLSFDTNFPALTIYSLMNNVENDSIYGRMLAYVENNGQSGSAVVAYGTHPDSLIHRSATITIEADEEESYAVVDIPFGPLDANRTYYASLEASNAFRTSRSDTSSTETNYPGITMLSVNASTDGSVYILGNVAPNGFSGTYGMRYGTHPDSLDTVYGSRPFSSESAAFDAGFSLYDLDLSKTYYAVLTADGFSGRSMRTPVFSWDFIYPDVIASRVETSSDLSAEVVATIDTKGMDLDFWVLIFDNYSFTHTSDTVRVSGGTEPVEVRLPLGTFPRFAERTLMMALQADGKPTVYADTTSFDLNYADITDAALVNLIVGDEAVIGVRADLSIADQRTAEYRIRFGQAGGALAPLSDAVDLTGTDTAIALEVNTGPQGLVPGTTYKAVIEVVSHSGKTTLSDTLSLTYVGKPEVIDAIVMTNADFTATFEGTIASNGRSGNVRLHYGLSPDNLPYQTDLTAMPASFDEQVVTGTLTFPFGRNQTWYAMLKIGSEGFSSIPTDTIVFDFNYPSISLSTITPFLIHSNLNIAIDVRNYGFDSELIGRFGFANHPDSLTMTITPINLVGQHELIYANAVINPVPLNDSVYVQLGVDNGFKQVWTPITGYFTRAPVAQLDSLELMSTGDDTFSAIVHGSIQTNGMSTSYRVLFSKQADMLEQMSSGDVEFGTASGVFSTTLSNLIKDTTYYAVIDVYNNVTYDVFTQTEPFQIRFTAPPEVEDLGFVAKSDLSVRLVGSLLSNGTALRYRAHYGTERQALTQQTGWVDVAATTQPTALDIPISGFDRFETGHMTLEVEPVGGAAFRTDTLSVFMSVPQITVGDLTIAVSGNVILPLKVDNGGFDATFAAVVDSDSTVPVHVDGSTELVQLELSIPIPGVGMILPVRIRTVSEGLTVLHDTLFLDIPKPDFTFVRAFARQDYVGVFDAVVNPNGFRTFVKFEYGAFGSISQSTTPIDLGYSTEPVTIRNTETSLNYNADHLVRMVVYGNNFSFISDTLHFNARIPGIGINHIQVISSDSAVVSVYVNSEGVNTYARLAYGPLSGGFPDTTAAVARATSENTQNFDLHLRGLSAGTTYQVKFLVQDQADLNKVVETTAQTFTTPASLEVTFHQVAGSAIGFDASTTTLEFPNTMAIYELGSYTVQMWFKTDDATRPVQFLSSKGMEYMEVHLTGGDRSLRFIPRPGQYFDTPANSVQTNVWTHLSAGIDAENNLVKVFLNGVEMPLHASGYNSGLPFEGTFPISASLHIGHRTDNSFHFGGEIDEIRLWRTARTPLQVWDDMHGTTPSVPNAALALYAQLNEGAGLTVADAAGGNVGSLSGDEPVWLPSSIPIHENATYRARLTGQAGWRLIASPVATTVGQLLADVWTQGFTGASTPSGSPNVFTWNAADASNSASNWVPVGNANQPLAPGDGVFVYVYASNPGEQGGFPKSLAVTGRAASQTPSLSNRLNPNTNGWALVGNPHPTDIVWGDLGRSGLYNVPYLWDANEDEWVTWNGSVGSLTGGRIGAFNAFFVATLNENPSLTVPFDARRAGPSQFVGKVAEMTSGPSFSLKIESPDGRSNRAWFSFDTDGQLGLDARDAFKLAPYSSQYVQLASVLQDSLRLDINHLPLLTEALTVPLAVRGTASGTYRLSLDSRSLPSGWDMLLTDTQTGLTSRLDEPMSFTWTGGATAETTRFRLTVSPTTITDIETGEEAPLVFALDQNVPNPFNPTTVIRWTLDAPRTTRLSVYDMLGREVAVLADGVMPAGRHSVTFDGSGLASGVYLYRLQSGNQILTRRFTLIK